MSDFVPDIQTAALTRQSYGIAMAQGRYGGPRGIWLECTRCEESQVIVGSRRLEWSHVPDSDVAAVFRRHGWTGSGDKMMRAKCPVCAQRDATTQAERELLRLALRTATGNPWPLIGMRQRSGGAKARLFAKLQERGWFDDENRLTALGRSVAECVG